jgi:hypothetical protein
MMKYTQVRVNRLPVEVRQDVTRALMGPFAGKPIASIQGTERGRGVTHLVRGKTQCIRRNNPHPYDPKTPSQLIQRAQWGQAKQHWKTLSAAQRGAWQAYAERYIRQVGMLPGAANVGYNLFMRAQGIRTKRGLGPGADAPAAPPPQEATVVRSVAAESATQFRFAVDHQVNEITDMHVLAEITPATPRLRKPRETDLRYICGPTPASFVPLQSSGTTYTVDNAQFAVEPGQRYGLRVRIVSVDDLPSTGKLWDFVKE